MHNLDGHISVFERMFLEKTENVPERGRKKDGTEGEVTKLLVFPVLVVHLAKFEFFPAN